MIVGIHHIGVLIAALVLNCPVAAGATAGDGRYPRGRDVLAAANAAPLDRIGDDAVRFSSTPALGGRGVIIEIHRRDRQWAIGTIALWMGSPQRWTRTATIMLELPIAEFDALTRQIDAQLASGEPQPATADELIVCTDGPGYVTERRKDSRSRWLSGFCGNHPNNRIAALMAGLAAQGFRRWLPDFMATGNR